MLDKYEYEKLAEEVAQDYIHHNKPVSVSIKIIAINKKMNPEQIKRLTEFANIKTYNKLYDSSEDKTFKFELGDSKKIIDDVYSDKKDEGKKVEVVIKNDQPVQYSDKLNPKNPVRDTEVLGDDDELEVSKNLMHNQDSASDTYLDALKVPEKNYGYTDGLDEAGNTMPLKGEDRGDIKEASVTEEKETKVATASKEAMLRELEYKALLKYEELVDEYRKTASLFLSCDKEKKFRDFESKALCHYGEKAASLIKDLSTLVGVPVNENIKVAAISRKDDYGIPNVAALMKAQEAYLEVKEAMEKVSALEDTKIEVAFKL